MLFPTAVFAIFFFVTFVTSWNLERRPLRRKLFLVAASYVFYGWWDWRFVSLLIASSAFNYACGLALEQAGGPRSRAWLLGLGVAANLGVLGFFKYYNFFLVTFAELAASLGLERDLPFLNIILPVGISFFTFQGISYIVDIHRRETTARKSLIDVMLYISFFPQLVAGPIVRAAHFMKQLDEPLRLNRQMVIAGFLLITVGLFKKMIIANYLATEIVDTAFFDPTVRSGLDLLGGVYAYAVQIYCDFSAYSEIAIGTALLLGYRFHRNFNQPYRATSLRDFWRRWHISLSTWLRDYLYKPLGGSRKGRLKTYRNLMITMTLGGIWHGASLTFLAWGVLHGAGLMVERGWLALRKPGATPIHALIGLVFVFHFVCAGWILFRAESFSLAADYFTALVTNWGEPAVELATPFVCTLIAVGMAFHFLPRNGTEFAARRLTFLPSPVLGGLFGLTLVLLDAVGPGEVTPFIYFQF